MNEQTDTDRKQDSSELAASAGLPAGSLFDSRFEIIEELGSGTFGTVYKASDKVLFRDVAIKVLRQSLISDEASRKRFLQESQTLGSLEHPNIVKVYGQGQLPNSQLYIVMDFVNGENLSEILVREKTLGDDRFFAIFEQVLDGIAFAHNNGIVHRDIKPENIMVSENGLVRILDFGIAKNISMQPNMVHTSAGVHLGSSSYMSPEQCTGALVDARSDLYSLGCVIYECLLGKQAFPGNSDMEIMYKQIHKSITSSNRLSGMPKSMRAFLSRALQKEPAKRFQTATEMKEQLLASRPKPPTKTPKSLAGPLFVAAVLLFGLIATFVAYRNSSHVDKSKKIQGIRTAEQLKDYLDNNKVPIQDKLNESKRWLSGKEAISKSQRANVAMARSIAGAYLGLHDSPQLALELYRKAMKDKDLLRKKDSAFVCLGLARWAQTCGRLEEAIAAYTKAAQLDPALRGDCEARMVDCYIESKDFRRARELVGNDLRNHEGPFDHDYFQKVLSLHNIYMKEGKEADAERINARALAVLSKDNPENFGIAKIQLLLNQGYHAQMHRDFSSAEKLYKEANELSRRVHFNSDVVMRNVSQFHINTGQFEKAIPILEELSDKADLSSGFYAYIVDKTALANTYRQFGKLDKALLSYRQFLDSWMKEGEHQTFTLSEYWLLRVNILEPIFSIYQRKNQLHEFHSLARDVIARLPDGIEKAAWLAQSGRCYCVQQKFKDGLDCFQKAIACFPANDPAFNSARQLEKIEMAEWLLVQDKVDEAEKLILQVIESFGSDKNTSLKDMASAKRVLAGVREKQGRKGDCLQLRKEVVELVHRDRDLDSLKVAQMQSELGYAFLRLGQFRNAAEKYAEAAVTISSNHDAGFSQPCLWAEAGSTYLEAKDLQEARICFERINQCLDPALKEIAARNLVLDLSQVEMTREFLRKLKNASISEQEANKVQKLEEKLNRATSAAKT